jgi:hypothetical protein
MSVYLANGRTRGDTLPTRYLPFALLQRGTFCLDDMPGFDGSPQAWWTQRTATCLVSDYPVASALLALPIYAPFAWAGVAKDGPWPVRLEKLAAASIVAASACLLYLVLSRLTGPVSAALLAAVFGLGTTNLSTNAQALWHHDSAVLGLIAALYCIVRGRDAPAWLARAAFPLAFAVISRPQIVFVVAPVAVYVLMLRPGLVRVVAWGLPPVLFHAWYNTHYFGSPLRTQVPVFGGLFSMDLAEGLFGVLLSPGRGLFVYSPIFLLSLVGAVLVWRRHGDGLLRALSLGIVPTVVFYACYLFWHGGSTYGPRYLGDLNATLTLLLVPLVPWVRRGRGRLALVAALAAISVTSHVYGAFRYDGEGDSTDFIERLWLWQRQPLVGHVLPPPAIARAPEPFFRDLGSRSATGVGVRLHANAARFHRGETLVLGLQAENASRYPLELYVGIAVPAEGVALFSVARQTLVTSVPISYPEWFRALRILAPDARVVEPRLFRFTVPTNMTPGDLWAFAALVERATRPWRVVAADAQSIEIRP